MKTIKIIEEFKIPGTEIVLEKGDEFKIIEAIRSPNSSYGTFVRITSKDSRGYKSLEYKLPDGRSWWPVEISANIDSSEFMDIV